MGSCVKSSGPESKEAIEFCLNCKTVGCNRGMCNAFYEKFVLPCPDGRRGRRGKYYEYNGEMHTLREWSYILDIPLYVLYHRRDNKKCGQQLFAPYKRGGKRCSADTGNDSVGS